MPPRKRIILGETIEEKMVRKRRETAQRIRVLGAVAIITIIARILIKDPVRPPPADHSNAPIRIMPGMPASLPPSERARLDPQLIAKMMLADEEAKKKVIMMASARPHAPGAYKPAAAPEIADISEEKAKQQLFAKAKRQQAVERVKEDIKKDLNAQTPALVCFTNGGRLKVGQAGKEPGAVTIRMAGVAATFPDRMIESVLKNAADWEEPVPRGMVKLKPAPGITIILSERAAKCVTVSKRAYDEI